MGIKTIIGILIVVPTFYFIGRWFKNHEPNKEDINPDNSAGLHKTTSINNIVIESLGSSIKNWIIGFVILGIIGAILFFLFWLDSWNRLSPEEQARIETQHQLYVQNLKHCQAVLNAENINLNNAEFQRCNELIGEFETNAPTDINRQSGPYEY